MTTEEDNLDWMRGTTLAAATEPDADPAAAEAWDRLGIDKETQEQMVFEAALKEFETAKLVFEVFSEGRGPELLDWLRRVTIEAPFMQVSKSLFASEVSMSAGEFSMIRWGQNDVVHMIETMMKRAVDAPPVAPNQKAEGTENG